MNGRQKRLAVYRHNGLSGSAHMIKGQCRAIISCPTTTDESRKLASEILGKSLELIKSLKTRRTVPCE